MNFINTKTLPHFSQSEKGFWMVSSNHFCFLFINFQMSLKPTFRLKPSLLDLECSWNRFSPLGIERLVLAGGSQADDYSSYLYAFEAPRSVFADRCANRLASPHLNRIWGSVTKAFVFKENFRRFYNWVWKHEIVLF